MIIRAFNIAVEAIKEIPENNSDFITQAFTEGIKLAVNNLSSEAFTIDIATVEHAKCILDYFNLHKLVLANYEVQADMSFDTVIDLITYSIRQKNTSLNPIHISSTEAESTESDTESEESVNKLPSKAAQRRSTRMKKLRNEIFNGSPMSPDLSSTTSEGLSTNGKTFHL